MSWFYIYIFRIVKKYSIPIFIIVIDILCTIIRKLKISERIYNKLISKITYVEDETEYNDIDNIDEICNLEINFFYFIYLFFILIFNFIHFTEKDLNLIDCKGTPNPKYFGDSTTSLISLLIIVRSVMNFAIIIFTNFFISNPKYLFPSFQKGLIYCRIFTIHFLLIQIAPNMLFLGIRYSLIFE